MHWTVLTNFIIQIENLNMHINNCDDRAGTTSYNIRVIIYIPSNIPSLEMLVFSGTCYAQFKKEY